MKELEFLTDIGESRKARRDMEERIALRHRVTPWYAALYTTNRLRHTSIPKGINEGPFPFGGTHFPIKLGNACSMNSVDKIVTGGSWNPLFRALKGMLHEDSSHASSDDESVIAILGKRLFNSSLRTLVETTVRAPCDRVCLLLQCQKELMRSGRLSAPYKGITNCFARIIKNEGVFSLWRGCLAKTLAVSPTQVINLVVISAVEIEFDMHRSDTNEDVSREQYEFEHLVALAAARGACSICLIPLEYARTRLANDIKCVESGCERQFKGLRDVFRKTLKSDGVLGVYRGISFAYIGLLVYDFFSFPSIRKLEQDLYKKVSLGDFAGHAVNAALAILGSYPCFTVARRTMMRSGEAVKYKGPTDAFMQIIRNEGVQSLYKGLGAHVLSIASLYCAYEAYGRWGGSISISIK